MILRSALKYHSSYQIRKTAIWTSGISCKRNATSSARQGAALHILMETVLGKVDPIYEQAHKPHRNTGHHISSILPTFGVVNSASKLFESLRLQNLRISPLYMYIISEHSERLHLQLKNSSHLSASISLQPQSSPNRYKLRTLCITPHPSLNSLRALQTTILLELIEALHFHLSTTLLLVSLHIRSL